jgi:hypothetical protein
MYKILWFVLFSTDSNYILYTLAISALTVHCVQLLVRGKLVFNGMTVNEFCIRSLIKCMLHAIWMSPHNKPWLTQMVFRSTAILTLNLGSTRGWAVSPMLWPLYPCCKGSFSDCTSGWDCPRASLDEEGKFAPSGIWPQDHPAGSYTDCTILALLNTWSQKIL